MSDRKITFFHCPQTRSSGIYTLLEELGAPYDLHVLNLKAGDGRKPEFLALNPLGKVPAVRHGDSVITEQVALYIYLADLFPEAGLTPGLADPLRGPYLRWIAYYGSCFEPALIDHHMKRDPAVHAMSPYGTYDEMLDNLVTQLRPGPYLLGGRFTAADVLWGTALGWTTAFGLVPKGPEIAAYLDRLSARPAFKKAAEVDAKLAAGMRGA